MEWTAEKKPKPAASADWLWPGVSLPRYIFASVVANTLQSLAQYPLELVKTRLQVNPSPQRFVSAFFVTGRRLVAEFGWQRGLYRGVGFYIISGLPDNIVGYAVYNASLKFMQKHHEDSISWLPKVLIPAAAGGLSELASALIWIPQDVITQRLQVGDGMSGSLNGKPGGALFMLKQVYRERGLRGFYVGSCASMATYIPNGMIWWATYEFAKTTLEQPNSGRNLENDDEAAPAVTLTHVFAGAAAGITSSVLTNPLDVCKTRVQTGRLCYGSSATLGVMRCAVEHEGFAALGKGLFGRIAVAVPSAIFSGVAYEATMSFAQAKIPT